jgi:hypothetical protein
MQSGTTRRRRIMSFATADDAERSDEEEADHELYAEFSST